MKKLTIKQKKFADEYIISGNATESYKVAGYKYSSDNMASVEAHKLLRNPKVKTYIDERMRKLEEEAIANQNEILKFLTRVIRDEETEETLISRGEEGQEITTVKLSGRDRIRAAELLGKRYGSWTDKLEVEAESRVVIVDDLED